MLAEITEDGARIGCATEFRHKDLIKSIPGARWDASSGLWLMSLSWSSCLALRATFGNDLEIGPNLHEWATQHRTNLIDPAMKLREVIGSDEGDPDLFPHQRADVEFLSLVRKAILSSEMGVGKTPSAIRAMKKIHDSGEPVFPALVVGPNSVKENWKREFERWWPGVKAQVINGTASQRRKQLQTEADVYIINYESLRAHSRLQPYGSIALRRCVACGGSDPTIKDTQCQAHKRELNEIDFVTVVADEVHRAKEPKSQQTRALKAAAQGAVNRFALTGTPVANTHMDLWSILNFIDPDEWPSKTRWMDRLINMTYNVWGGTVVSGVKPERRDEFDATILPRMRRMTKEVVLPFLPPILTERRDVQMSPKQKKAYTQLAEKMIAELDTGEMLVTTNTLTQSLRLLQLASSYGELDVIETIGEDGWPIQKERLILTNPSSKVDAFIDDLGDYEGRAVLVFTVSSQLLHLLSEALTKRDIPHGKIVGKQFMAERQTSIDDFQAGKTKFILATVGAGGTGITLTAANTVVYLQRSWSLIDMEQSHARAHRIGSEVHDSILQIDYVTPNTMEEAVIAALEGKSAGLEDLVRDKELLRRAINGNVEKKES